MATQEIVSIPADVQTESGLLGACFANPKSFGIATEELRPEHFQNIEHQKIFRAMLEVSAGQRAITQIAVREALEGDVEFQRAGGTAVLAQCAANAIGTVSVPAACRRIQRLSLKRRALYLGGRLVEAAGNPAMSVQQLLEEYGPEFDQIRDQDPDVSRGIVHVSALAVELEPIVERLAQGRGLMLGESSGFSSLDKIVPGLGSGELWILGGRPSGGKSAMAVNLTLRLAERGKGVAFYSLEMSAASLLLRLACLRGRVDYQRVASGTLSREGTQALSRALGQVAELPIWIDARPVVQAHELRWRLRAAARREGIRLAVVDYLQLLRGSGENRTSQITSVSLELKAAARELGEICGGTLLAVSQLNRLAVGEEPELHHLRESGQIEQDADVVLFLYDEKHSGWTEAELRGKQAKTLKVAKQRNGPCDKLSFDWLPLWMGFEE